MSEKRNIPVWPFVIAAVSAVRLCGSTSDSFTRSDQLARYAVPPPRSFQPQEVAPPAAPAAPWRPGRPTLGLPTLDPSHAVREPEYVILRRRPARGSRP